MTLMYAGLFLSIGTLFLHILTFVIEVFNIPVDNHGSLNILLLGRGTIVLNTSLSSLLTLVFL